MSKWTHVAGIIRIDSFRFDEKTTEEEVSRIKESLGKILTYKDLYNCKIGDNLETNVPMGSEGTLEYTIHINPEISCVSSYTVSIFGDLRDYAESEEIIQWFDCMCSKFLIRQAVIQIDVEGEDTIIHKYIEE